MLHRKNTSNESVPNVQGLGFYSGKLSKYNEKNNVTVKVKTKKNIQNPNKPLTLKLNINKKRCHEFNEYFEKKQKLQNVFELKFKKICLQSNIYPSNHKFIKDYEFYDKKSHDFQESIVRSLSCNIKTQGGQCSKMAIFGNIKFETQQIKLMKNIQVRKEKLIQSNLLVAQVTKKKKKKHNHSLFTIKKQDETQYHQNDKECELIHTKSQANFKPSLQQKTQQYYFKIYSDVKKQYKKYNQQTSFSQIKKSQDYMGQELDLKSISKNQILPNFISKNSRHQNFLQSLKPKKIKQQSQFLFKLKEDTKQHFRINSSQLSFINKNNINSPQNEKIKSYFKKMNKIQNQSYDYKGYM